VTSIGVTLHYKTLKLLFLIEDYNVSKFHVTFTQRYWKTIYKTLSQIAIYLAIFLFINFTTKPTSYYSYKFYFSAFRAAFPRHRKP